jgi:hypothetical protein
MVQMTTYSFTVGATNKTSQQIQIVTAFPNAQVDLYVQQAYETNGPSGRWLIGAKLERSASPTFTTVQLLVGNQEEYYIPPPDGFAGHFKYLKFRIIDSVPTAGNWYYRLQLNVGQINGANTTGEPLSVIGAEKSGNNFDYSNYIIYEVTNGFTI